MPVAADMEFLWFGHMSWKYIFRDVGISPRQVFYVFQDRFATLNI